MKASYTITCTKYTQDADMDSSEVVEGGTDDLRDILTRARRTYGIAPHDRSVVGTPWWTTQGTIENRDYFEKGLITEYTLTVHGIGYHDRTRISRVNALLSAIR